MANVQLKVDDTLGAALVGFAVSCAVFGVLSIQCFTYFRRYPMDRAAYKALVASIWLLEVIDQAFIGHVVYFYTISNFFSPLALLIGDVHWTLIAQLLLGACVGVIVKTCFAMRVWRFSSHNIWITGTILLLTYGQLGLAIAYAVRAFQLRKLALAYKLKLIASLSLGSGALTDILTATALTYFLRQLRTGYHKSDTLVNSLTVYAINTGALTSAFSLCTLILYDINPMNFEFLAFYFILSKLYAVSFLATLNTRKIVRGRGTDRQGGTGGTSAPHNLFGNNLYMIGHHGRTQQSQSASKGGLEIDIQQEVSMVSDDHWRPPTRDAEASPKANGPVSYWR